MWFLKYLEIMFWEIRCPDIIQSLVFFLQGKSSQPWDFCSRPWGSDALSKFRCKLPQIAEGTVQDLGHRQISWKVLSKSHTIISDCLWICSNHWQNVQMLPTCADKALLVDDCKSLYCPNMSEMATVHVRNHYKPTAMMEWQNLEEPRPWSGSWENQTRYIYIHITILLCGWFVAVVWRNIKVWYSMINLQKSLSCRPVNMSAETSPMDSLPTTY